MHLREKLPALANLLGGWPRFRRSHLHDYPTAAVRWWLLVALAGAFALAAAAADLARRVAPDLWQLTGWTAIVAVAAAFPIQIPRTKHSISTGDILVFLLLALHGAAAAVVAATLEGLIASSRTSARLSSRIATPAAAAVAMTLGGFVFAGSELALRAQGLPGPAAHLVALALGAIGYFAVSTTSLMQVVYLKRGVRLTVPEWFSHASWVGALYLVSALVAGLLSLHAQQFGRSATVVSVLVIGLALALLRAHFRQQIAEHEAQEARVAAAEQEAKQNQKRFHSAFTHASIGMAIVSPGGDVAQVNQALCELVGLPERELLGRPFRSLLHPGDAALLERQLAEPGARGKEGQLSIELRCLGGANDETWVSLHCAPFEDHAGDGLIFQLHDITSRRRAEGELHHIAYHDGLTDLANRNCFQERLRVAVERTRGDRRYGFAVMYLDIDRFKFVNDSLGHTAGDALLKEVARRLSASVRPRDLVARLGGDEFAVLVEDATVHADVLALGERLMRALEAPARIHGTEVRLQASIGVTFSDLGYREPEELLRDADLAMFKAKADGKGRLALFDASLHAAHRHKLQLETDLRRAIERGDLSLAFQPLFDLEPLRLNGFEALMRWQHPVHGPISPGVFIPLAEETGCIGALTAWAVDEAVRHLAAWRREGADPDLLMHVNVSGKDLGQARLLPHVRDVLQRHGVPAHLLTLEITETMLMAQREVAMGTLADLRALGVKLGIDDFGTGYSSLAYLSTLPFDCLKIDRSFVMGMRHSPQNVEIVRTILSLGRTLNKQVVAEGIETAEELQRLRQLGAPVGQGYLLGRPLAADRARELAVRALSPA